MSIVGVMASLQELSGLLAGLRTSKVQHKRLLKNILACPMTFFDQTPIGRILNRFSKDVDVLDQVLPRLFLPLMRYIFYLLGSLIITATLAPWSLVVWLFLSVFYIIIQVQNFVDNRKNFIGGEKHRPKKLIFLMNICGRISTKGSYLLLILVNKCTFNWFSLEIMGQGDKR